MRRTPPPLWFSICVAVALAWVCRYALPGSGEAALAGGHQAPPSQAFLGLIIFVVSAIWKGLEAAARVTLAAVAYSVKLLWLFASKSANALIDLGHGVLTGLRAAWKFFELSYEKVIKPAFTKFWRWFDKFRKWLDDTFGPTLRFLRRLRDNLLRFWKTYVRPWLDFIDVTRRVLRVLSSLGLAWAAALDKRLGDLEARIERPFQLLLAKVNEVINLVNRVVTLDGLFQRVALIRSLGRDYQYAWRAIAQPYTRALTEADRRHADDKLAVKSLRQIENETRAYVRDGGGPRAALIDEMTIVWRNQLRQS
jgi:hypothetical protein